MGSSSLVGLEGDVARHFDRLSVRGQVLAEYIWVGGTGSDLRSKSRVLNFKPHSVEDLPIGQFDGSLTGQVRYLLGSCAGRRNLASLVDHCRTGWCSGRESSHASDFSAGTRAVFHGVPQAPHVRTRYALARPVSKRLRLLAGQGDVPPFGASPAFTGCAVHIIVEFIIGYEVGGWHWFADRAAALQIPSGAATTSWCCATRSRLPTWRLGKPRCGRTPATTGRRAST